MEQTSPNLPDDVQLCHHMIGELLDEVKLQQFMIDKLQFQMEQMLRHRYGQRSDRFHPGQLPLFDVGEKAEQDNKPIETQEVKSHKRKKSRGRKPLPESLPRERVVHDVPEGERACPKCGEQCQCFGEDVSEQLEYVPASFYIVEHARKKYACKNKECDGAVIMADKPSQPIDKGLAGPGLLAHIVTSKYCDHQPLYRLESILNRHGVDISRQTMCGWAMSCADLLSPLYYAMTERVLSSEVIHTDDTPVPVLDKSMPKTKTGRLWIYVGDAKNYYTVFDYTESRRRDGPMNFMSGFTGYIQADAYSGYDPIYGPEKATEVACWAHARRKFVDAQSSDPERAAVAGVYIKTLYEVEKRIKELGLSRDEIKEFRGRHSEPVLKVFGQWLKDELSVVLPKSPLGGAIGYVLSNWEALNVYTTDGALDIDNNEAERGIRMIAIGRKNWLFAGNDRGGKAAAIFYSFVASCKNLNIDPFAYFRDVFAKISDYKTTRLEELLPDRWLEARQQEINETATD